MTTNDLRKVIERTSKLVGLDLNYFIYNGSWVYLSYTVSILTGLILSYFYANNLNKTVYGQFNFVLSVFSLVGVFSLPGMGQALTLALIKGFQGNFIKAIKYTIYFSLVGVLIIFSLAILDFLKGQSQLIEGLVVLGLLFPLISISTYYQSQLSSVRKFKIMALINTANFMLTCVTVILVILVIPSLPLLIAASLGTPLILNLIFTYNETLSENNLKVDKSYLNLGIHLSFTSSISFLSKSLDKIIIGLLLPIEFLALYSFALLIP